MMLNRMRATQQLASLQFTLWELHLYLDTHPLDTAAEMRLCSYRKAYMQMRTEFEEQFGPLTAATGHGEAWLKSPWPCENKEECVK